MKTKEITIKVPEGYEIDQENSTFECIKFKPKPIKKELPTTWSEFCETHNAQKSEYWITHNSMLQQVEGPRVRGTITDRNILPSKELAEAMIALCQLIQLRDCYNDGWTPDWTDLGTEKYCINVSWDKIHFCICCYEQSVLIFKTEELRNKFLENFRDLIEIAKPLL